MNFWSRGFRQASGNGRGRPFKSSPMDMQWISLLTDWGLQDHYVAQLKAKIWGEMPEARILDVSHQVPRADVYSAAYMLADFLPFCPPGSIHIVGVNDIASDQTPHVVAEVSSQYVIGADNGFFPLFFYLLKHRPEKVVEIDLWQESDVLTFPARDLFVKVAALIAGGEALESIGNPSSIRRVMMEGGLLKTLPEKGPDGKEAGLRVVGKILFVDGFRNVVTNITKEVFEDCLRRFPDYALELASRRVQGCRLVKAYPDVQEGDVAMIFLENGLLEIAMNQGQCARLYGLRRNDEVHVVFRNPQGRRLRLL